MVSEVYADMCPRSTTYFYVLRHLVSAIHRINHVFASTRLYLRQTRSSHKQFLKPLAPFIFASAVTFFGVVKLQDAAVSSE